MHDLLCKHPMLVQISNELDVAKGSPARLHHAPSEAQGPFTVRPSVGKLQCLVEKKYTRKKFVVIVKHALLPATAAVQMQDGAYSKCLCQTLSSLLAASMSSLAFCFFSSAFDCFSESAISPSSLSSSSALP